MCFYISYVVSVLREQSNSEVLRRKMDVILTEKSMQRSGQRLLLGHIWASAAGQLMMDD